MPMTDLGPSRPPPARATPPSSGRPVRKDEIELHDRGLYIESWLPERRSRRKPLLFVHGELGGSWVWERYLRLLRRPRLGGARAQPAQPLLVADRGPDELLVRDLHRGRRRGARAARAERRWRSATGWAACSSSRPSSACRSSAYVLIAPEPAARAPRPGPAARGARGARRLRPPVARLGDAAREAPARRIAT